LSIQPDLFNALTNLPAKFGAILYLLWGLLHVGAAYGIYTLGVEQSPGIVQARLFQDAAFLAVIACVVSFVAISRNWRNDPAGYWANLAFASVADIIFLALVVVPGHIPLLRGLVGPALWVAAVVFSTVGYLRPAR